MNEEFFVCLKFSFPGFFELEKFYTHGGFI